MMKLFEKLISPYSLLIINIAIIVLAESLGGGTFFDKSGLIHAVAWVFVFLIIIRIFSSFAFSDYILRGFLNIQLAFSLILGAVYAYEYIGLDIISLDKEVVESTATLLYFLWLIGNQIALEFVLRIYQKRSIFMTVLLSLLAVFVFAAILATHYWGVLSGEFAEIIHGAVLAVIVTVGAVSIWRLAKVKEIMPVFREYARFATPAIVLVVITAFMEYAESEEGLAFLGISELQNLYFAHFFIYAALSLLLIGFGKLKRPKGIYADM